MNLARPCPADNTESRPMSEYQYYEFVATDRPLDDRQLDELRSLSTRAVITRTSFVNEYHWGNFRGDPLVLMERYFDAFLYLANWGTREVMIRVPARLLTLDTAQQYLVGDAVSARLGGDQVILCMTSEDDAGDWEQGCEGWLSSIIPARAELAAGDLRALYLAWLLSAQTELDDDEIEPPVPPGLGTLTGPLQSLADFLRIDKDLIAVAATASDQSPGQLSSDTDLTAWIESIPTAEKNALLLSVVRDDDRHLRAQLLRRFHDTGSTRSSVGERTVGQLLATAAARREARELHAEQARAEQAARRQQQAAIAREKYLESLAPQEDDVWHRVSTLIDTKKPREYDTAVQLLQDLRDLAERRRHSDAFEQRLTQLRLQHQRKPSLLQRFDRAGLPATSVSPTG
jgi:hypothetical protein